MNRTTIAVCVIAGGMLSLLLIAIGPPATGLRLESAQAHCVAGEKVHNRSIREDRFRTFDFQNRQSAGRCNVDWPASLLFWNNASVPKVKNRFEEIGWDRMGSSMQARLDDGAGMAWDGDEGVKTFSPSDCAFGDMEHMRLYAVYTDNRMYNLSWGYWALGTSHIDNRECSPGGWSGESERAEDRIADDAGRVRGVTDIAEDWDWWGNDLPRRTASDGHRLHNNGRATAIRFR
jgi:hypothetical protein